MLEKTKALLDELIGFYEDVKKRGVEPSDNLRDLKRKFDEALQEVEEAPRLSIPDLNSAYKCRACDASDFGVK